jgi:hypothetical protein
LQISVSMLALLSLVMVLSFISFFWKSFPAGN